MPVFDFDFTPRVHDWHHIEFISTPHSSVVPEMQELGDGLPTAPQARMRVVSVRVWAGVRAG